MFHRPRPTNRTGLFDDRGGPFRLDIFRRNLRRSLAPFRHHPTANPSRSYPASGSGRNLFLNHRPCIRQRTERIHQTHLLHGSAVRMQ